MVLVLSLFEEPTAASEAIEYQLRQQDETCSGIVLAHW